MYKIVYSKAALKDATKIKRSNLQIHCQHLLEIISKAPFTKILSYEKLIGDLAGCYSRRINIQHRLVYSVDEKSKIIKILRMWSHYE